MQFFIEYGTIRDGDYGRFEVKVGDLRRGCGVFG